MKINTTLVTIIILGSGLTMQSCSGNNPLPPTLTPTLAPTFTQLPVTSSDTPTATITPFDDGAIRILEYENHYPSLSPGRYLTCFYLGGSFNTHKLEVVRIDDGERFQYLEGFIAGGSISPDGKKVAIFSGELYVIDLENDDYDTYPISHHVNSATWSPDGTHIAFDTDSEGFLIFSLESRTLTLIPISSEDAPTASEVGGFYGWSPDQNWFAFYRQYNRGPEIVEGLYVFDTSCFETPEVCMPQAIKITSPPLNGPIAWTPDNNLAVVDWSQSNGETIDVYRIPEGEIMHFFFLDNGLGPIGYFFWLADDGIVVNEDRSQFPIWLSTDGQNREYINSCTGRSSYWFTISSTSPDQ